MAGQPQVSGWIRFNVRRLEVSADPGPDPVNIVKHDEPFELKATFRGREVIWGWLENAGLEYKVCFAAEGLGHAALEADLGCETGNLAQGVGTYESTHTVAANTLVPGVYKMACLVTFDAAPGLTGFYEKLVIQVY